MKSAAKGPLVCIFVMLAVLLKMASASYAQQVFPFESFRIKLEVLSEDDFNREFGDNADIPRTEEAILALAHRLYPQSRQDQDAAYPENGEIEAFDCRNYELGLLFAALKNPAVSDSTRQQVDKILSAPLPILPKKYTSGHFTIYYTSTDPDPRNNISDMDISAAAGTLNFLWDRWTAFGLKAPKSYLAGNNTEMIDVYVWYLGGTKWGETQSDWDSINFNSVIMKNECKRRFVSAHELFHRVQFSYGYESVAASDLVWLTEGSALSVNAGLGTVGEAKRWLVHANDGLKHPERALSERGADASHFWVYLNFFGSPGHYPLTEVWAAYEQNGKNAKNAISTVVKASPTLNLYGVKNFEGFVQHWIKANYVKDYDGALATAYLDYMYDEYVTTACNVTYGPMAHVPRTVYEVPGNATALSFSGKVAPYAARYYELNLGSTLSKLTVKIDGADSGNFSYHFIGIKGKNSMLFSFTDTNVRDYTYSRTLTPGQWDKLALIVAGRSKGGSFKVKVGP
jgi:hypothetical protein